VHFKGIPKDLEKFAFGAIPTMLSSFTLWAKVKALADEK
jgi:hypothetical protein